MSNASEVKQSDIHVHHQSGKAFILVELHDRIVTELRSDLSTCQSILQGAFNVQDDLKNEIAEKDATIARQARVIEKLREQRDNLIPFALEEYATPMQVSDYRESLEYDVKAIEQGTPIK